MAALGGLEENLICSSTEQEKPSLSSFIFKTSLSRYNVCIYLDKTFAWFILVEFYFHTGFFFSITFRLFWLWFWLAAL